MINIIKRFTKLSSNVKQPIMAQLAQLYVDLENVFKTALAEGSFTVALRAKELQLKKLLSLASHEQSILPSQNPTSHDFIEMLEKCSDDDLTQISHDLALMNGSSTNA